MRKYLLVLLIFGLLVFATGCDTELGHSHEDHDHDGDGIPDHTAEEHHEERFQKLLSEVKKGTVLKKEKAIYWVCRECGYVYFGIEPPEKCPSCDHPKGFYQVRCEEY